MTRIGLLMFWFAVVDNTGQAIFLEYRTYQACELMRKTYSTVPSLKVTDCSNKSTEETNGPIHGM